MDLSSYKSLRIGGIDLVKLVINGVVAWAKKTFTNLVPLSTDTDGSIFNGVGYKDNTRLSSSGGVSSSAQDGSVTTGFIPWNGADTDIIRLKGVEWQGVAGKHYYLSCYDASKNFLAYFYAGDIESYTHVVVVTRENGVTTIDFNETYGTSNSTLQFFRQSKYIRINAEGRGADMILTINEEIS